MLFICIFFIPFINSNTLSNINIDSEVIDFNPNGFVWPLPGYTRISSYFGKRNSPTSGASSSHSGIDIPAPPGSKFIAVADGEITFTNFLGAGGYTITLSFDNFKVSYCHCDPNFIVKVGDKIKQGQIIGFVGPKNVYGVKGNQYFDSNGNPTNGATTGPHLHLGIRIDNKYQNPLDYF
ncbi:MAG: M23 family metallopeptidase [Clostridia bacterium]|nr:M23 family metallopeptidase [Clostridia bacterium]